VTADRGVQPGTIIEVRAVVVPGDDVDTDVLYPGPYLNIVDPEKMKGYLFEGLDPTLRDQLGGDVVLVVGENFGAGSSREHVPLAMKGWGIRCIVGKSFARIFYRNCINLGLLALQCREAAEAARTGSAVVIDTGAGTVQVDGLPFRVSPAPAFLKDLVTAGGLEAWARRRLGEDAAG
jgi:3-isopropylmalate/(R)-2-methylmalate dehydratase small subunit